MMLEADGTQKGLCSHHSETIKEVTEIKTIQRGLVKDNIREHQELKTTIESNHKWAGKENETLFNRTEKGLVERAELKKDIENHGGSIKNMGGEIKTLTTTSSELVADMGNVKKMQWVILTAILTAFLLNGLFLWLKG